MPMNKKPTKQNFHDSTPIYSEAKELFKKHSSVKNLILRIRFYITKHAFSLPERYKPKSILESRFTPPLEAFNKGMLSCGALTNISAEMLRSVGFKVRLIHGENSKSVDHAWLSVYEKGKGWVQYDLTRKELDITPEHKVKMICDDWEDIRDQILKDHQTYQTRKNRLINQETRL